MSESGHRIGHRVGALDWMSHPPLDPQPALTCGDVSWVDVDNRYRAPILGVQVPPRTPMIDGSASGHRPGALVMWSRIVLWSQDRSRWASDAPNGRWRIRWDGLVCRCVATEPSDSRLLGARGMAVPDRLMGDPMRKQPRAVSVRPRERAERPRRVSSRARHARREPRWSPTARSSWGELVSRFTRQPLW